MVCNILIDRDRRSNIWIFRNRRGRCWYCQGVILYLPYWLCDCAGFWSNDIQEVVFNAHVAGSQDGDPTLFVSQRVDWIEHSCFERLIAYCDQR
jgi:hypothetical protein